MTRVALDLLGGDRAPEQVLDGAVLVAERTPDVELVLVGPVELAERLPAARGLAGREGVVPRIAASPAGLRDGGGSPLRPRAAAVLR